MQKVLVANRGEIAIRAFRAATQLGIQTVAIHTWEDNGSLHRIKADESYEIGERGHPLRAYLDHELIVETALKAGADAIYPGYGFLSESPDLAEACEAAPIRSGESVIEEELRHHLPKYRRIFLEGKMSCGWDEL